MCKSIFVTLASAKFGILNDPMLLSRAGPFKLSWAHAMFVASATLNLLSVRAMDTIMLHVLLNGYGWGAL